MKLLGKTIGAPGMTRRLLVVLLLALGLAAGEARAADDEEAPAVEQKERLVLVGGATGRTGRLIAALLVERGYRVRGMTRDTEAAKRDFGGAIEWVEADVRDPDSLAGAFEGVTDFVNAIGTENAGANGPEQVSYEGMKHLVEAAKAAGVDWFGLVSAGGVEDARAYIAKGLRDGATWRFRGEEHLRASGLAYTIVRAGGLRDFPGGENGILLLQKEDVPPGLISRADLAAVMVECVGNPAAAGKTFAVVNYLAVDPDGWRKALPGLSPDR